MLIESMQNDLIKKACLLKLKKNRDKLNLFIVEGLRFVQEIPEAYDIEEYLISQTFESNYNELNELKAKAKVYTIKDNIFKNICETQSPQGILAICSKKNYTLEACILNKNQFILICDKLQDPGNLGTIIRVADAAGVTNIILSKDTVDLYNPKVLRATMGSIFHLKIIQNIDINLAIDKLRLNKIAIIATDLKSDISPYQIDLKQSLAIIVGNEANGLDNNVLKQADILVKIPIMGKAESLNVSAASSILLYEVVRQRL